MNGPDRALAAVAERQFGVFSRDQALAIGFSEAAISRRTSSGRWERIYPAVYRLPGTPRTGRQRALAAVLWAGPESAISHTTAVSLLRLDGVRRDGLHLTVTTRSIRARDLVLHRARAFPSGDVVEVDGIRCTSGTRTIIDCASLLDDEALEHAFEQARRMGLTSPSALVRRAGELCGKGRAGSTRIHRLVAAQTPSERALESRLEVRLARLLRTSSLPPAQRQHPVGRYRLDFAWPAWSIGCECDGFEHHGGRLAWKRDRSRIASIEAAGWRLVHVTWDGVTREPRQTIERLGIALRAAA